MSWLVCPALADEAPPARQAAGLRRPRSFARRALILRLWRAPSEQRRDQLDNARGPAVAHRKAGRRALLSFRHDPFDRRSRGRPSPGRRRRISPAPRSSPPNLAARSTRSLWPRWARDDGVKALARDGDTLAGIGAPEDVALVEKYLATRGFERRHRPSYADMVSRGADGGAALRNPAPATRAAGRRRNRRADGQGFGREGHRPGDGGGADRRSGFARPRRVGDRAHQRRKASRIGPATPMRPCSASMFSRSPAKSCR